MGFKRHRWLWGLAIMALGVALITVASVLTPLMLPGAGFLYEAGMWAIVPLAGGVGAFFATRRGLNNYVAWAVPPLCQTAAHWLLLGYPPGSAGMPLVTAGVSLVAAAAAQVLNERQAQAHKSGGRRHE